MTLTLSTAAAIPAADTIPASTHAEAGRLSQVEYERLLGVLAQLSGADWNQPTYCSEWNVRQMTAHLAGAVTGSASFAEFRRQNMPSPFSKAFAEGVDATNRLQIAERADRTPAELVAEFRQNGPVAVRNRQKLPWPARKLRLPMGELGFASFEYLMDVIYPRDQWMHRYDICAATGKEMIVTPEHDGRIVALVLYDLGRKLKKQPGARTVDLQLVGALTTAYRFGRGRNPDAAVTLDFFDFNLLASGRIKPAELKDRMTLAGDPAAADWFLAQIDIPY